MHKRKWPEIISAVAQPDFTIDVTFVDRKTVTVDLQLLQNKVEHAKELLKVTGYNSFLVLPHALFWESQPGYNNILIDEIELSGGEIYNGTYTLTTKENRK